MKLVRFVNYFICNNYITFYIGIFLDCSLTSCFIGQKNIKKTRQLLQSCCGATGRGGAGVQGAGGGGGGDKQPQRRAELRGTEGASHVVELLIIWLHRFKIEIKPLNKDISDYVNNFIYDYVVD